MKTSPRSQRMATQLEPIVAELITRYLTPEDIGFCTITAIEVSGDRQVADVFVRSLDQPRGWLKALKKISPKLAHEVGKKLSLNQKLVIRFKEDQAVKLVEALKKHGL